MKANPRRLVRAAAANGELAQDVSLGAPFRHTIRTLDVSSWPGQVRLTIGAAVTEPQRATS